MNAIVTYLNFDGNCKAAMEFYAKCLGAELTAMPFSEMPGDKGNVEALKGRLMYAHYVQRAAYTNGLRFAAGTSRPPRR